MKIRTILGAACAITTAVGIWGAAQAQDADLGKRTFNQCRACHTVEAGKNRVGPSLHGVVGRVPGTLEGYKFSPAMIEFGSDGKTWTEAQLDEYLISPRTIVKGSRMVYPGLRKPEDRANLIAYLKSVVEAE